MATKEVIIIKVKLTPDQRKKYYIILGTGLIIALLLTAATFTVANNKPAMTAVDFSFEEQSDYMTIDVPMVEGDKLYYKVESDLPIDVRIVTNFEQSSWTEKEYHYTNSKEYVYTVKSDNTYTIFFDYGDEAASGTVSYGVLKDNSNVVTAMAISIFVSYGLFWFIGLIYAQRASDRNQQ